MDEVRNGEGLYEGTEPCVVRILRGRPTRGARRSYYIEFHDKAGSGEKHGYAFGDRGDMTGWTCTADPVSPGSSGDRYFYIDESGVIRMTTNDTTTSADQPLE